LQTKLANFIQFLYRARKRGQTYNQN